MRRKPVCTERAVLAHSCPIAAQQLPALDGRLSGDRSSADNTAASIAGG
jgi:hypothetical protein